MIEHKREHYEGVLEDKIIKIIIIKKIMIDLHGDFKIIEGKINVLEIKDNQQGVVNIKGI